ncbi:MAG: hypothetical protein ACKPKO_03325, partial [Candidatus Fonsibacter sp.]
MKRAGDHGVARALGLDEPVLVPPSIEWLKQRIEEKYAKFLQIYKTSDEEQKEIRVKREQIQTGEN